MFLVEFFAHPIGRLMTLVLLHFFWQGLTVLLVLLAIVELCGVRRAAARYALSLAALVVMAFCPFATLVWLALGGGLSVQSTSLHASLDVQPETRSFELWRDGTITIEILPQWLTAAQPYVLAAWLVGVTLVGGRLLTGIVGLSRMRRGRMPVPPDMARVVERLGLRLHMKALPVVFLSRHVVEAMAVGFVRPFVLIPASWAIEMPLEILEAIVAHELAHLRRRDLWVNLLQRIMEALLFYHPAVWWLSQRLRIERELCADEMAVAATGQRLAYVQALEQVAHRRRADVRPVLAAFLRGETHMRLLERVRNVLGLSVSEHSRLWPAGLIALILPLGLWMMSIGLPSAVADDERDDDKPVLKRKIHQIEFKDLDQDDDDRSEGKKNVEREKLELKPRKVDVRITEKEDQGSKILKEFSEVGESPKKTLKRKITRAEAEEEFDKVYAKPSSKEGQVIQELVASVKQLSAQVEKLQAEVAELRGEKLRKGSKGESLQGPHKVKESRQPDAGVELELDYKRYLNETEKSARARDKIRAEAEKRVTEKVLEQMQKELAHARDAALKAQHQADQQAERAKAEAEKTKGEAEKVIRRKLELLQEQEGERKILEELKEKEPTKQPSP